MFTLWSEWAACTVCGRAEGERRRKGFDCHFFDWWDVELVVLTANIQDFSVFISCRCSALLKQANNEALCLARSDVTDLTQRCELISVPCYVLNEATRAQLMSIFTTKTACHLRVSDGSGLNVSRRCCGDVSFYICQWWTYLPTYGICKKVRPFL